MAYQANSVFKVIDTHHNHPAADNTRRALIGLLDKVTGSTPKHEVLNSGIVQPVSKLPIKSMNNSACALKADFAKHFNTQVITLFWRVR